MASYPPPPPPPFSRADAKLQRRAIKAQVRLQKQQTRQQLLFTRRRSLVGPLFLVALGVVFLLVKMGRLSLASALGWYSHWWPVLLIAAGIFLLAEWMIDGAAQQRRAAEGFPVSGPRRVGGGVVWVLILVGVVGISLNQTHINFSSGDFRWPFGRFDLIRAVGDPHDSDDSMSEPIAADSSVTVDDARGDVTVSGTSSDSQVHVMVHKHVYALNDSDARDKAQKIQPILEKESGRLTVRVPYVQDGEADLTIEVPRTVSLTVTADHGEVRISAMHAPVVVNSNHGSVDLSELEGDVVAHMHSDSASLSAHSILGPLTVDGRTGDLNVTEIRGPVTLLGSFSGSTHLERIAGGVKFHTHRTDFQMARLDGEVEFDTGEDLHADQLLGPVLLKTSDRNITLERVQGNLDLANSNGSVTVTSASPLGTIAISNRRGSVDVGVPESAGFVVHAATRHGDVENDFSLTKQGDDEHPELNGTVGRGGPKLQIETSDGDVTVRKSTVIPLPATPPAPPKLSTVPAPPAVPAAPQAPVAPAKTSPGVRAPRPPKAPAAPVKPAV